MRPRVSLEELSQSRRADSSSDASEQRSASKAGAAGKGRAWNEGVGPPPGGHRLTFAEDAEATRSSWWLCGASI